MLAHDRNRRPGGIVAIMIQFHTIALTVNVHRPLLPMNNQPCRVPKDVAAPAAPASPQTLPIDEALA